MNLFHELNIMTSDYGQSFFKSDDKDRAGGFGNGHMDLDVRPVVVNQCFLTWVSGKGHVCGGQR